MNIPAEFVELVRNASNIAAVVGERVELRKSGAELVGRCPFHSEKTPSFYVQPNKGVFHCHGCNAGGDVFEFVRRLHKCTFRESVEYLAAKAGLKLNGFTPSAELTAKVASMRAQRQREAALQHFIHDRIEAVSRRHRALGRSATWAAIERYIDFEVRIEREGLCDPDIIKSEWEQRVAA